MSIISNILNTTTYQAKNASSKVPAALTNTNPIDTYESQDGKISTRIESTPKATESQEFRDVFHKFMGATMYGQMLKSMRQTQTKPAYFDGGRAEEIFQQQLDQTLVDKMTRATPKSFSDAMFKQMSRPKDATML